MGTWWGLCSAHLGPHAPRHPNTSGCVLILPPAPQQDGDAPRNRYDDEEDSKKNRGDEEYGVRSEFESFYELEGEEVAGVRAKEAAAAAAAARVDAASRAAAIADVAAASGLLSVGVMREALEAQAAAAARELAALRAGGWLGRSIDGAHGRDVGLDVKVIGGGGGEGALVSTQAAAHHS